MDKVINYENLRKFAYSNDKICTKPIKGIVLTFIGLGDQSMQGEETVRGKFFARQGIIFIKAYVNPWSWMNKQSAEYTDEIIEVLMSHYNLPKDLPIVSTGGSMGGQSALTYAVYTKHKLTACVASCPPCDLIYHFTERDDLPRTLYNAFYNAEGSFEDALKSGSPLYLVDKMPAIPYYIFHCDKDDAVSKANHSDPFVKAMKKAGHNIVYHEVFDRGHCDLTEEMWVLFYDYTITSVLGKNTKEVIETELLKSD